MPRLTDTDYLHIHHRLARLWSAADGVFGFLTPNEQWCLHEYFQSSKSWSDSRLLAHRMAISVAQPSLPQQAGKALSKHDRHSATYAVNKVRPAPAGTPKRRPTAERKISVRPVVHPEVDPQKLARAFIHLALSRSRQRSRP